MKKYVVMHDYGPEGWKIQAECDTMLDAVTAREDDVRNGSGTSEIFEHIPVLSAYSRANYESEDRERKAATGAREPL